MGVGEKKEREKNVVRGWWGKKERKKKEKKRRVKREQREREKGRYFGSCEKNKINKNKIIKYIKKLNNKVRIGSLM